MSTVAVLTLAELENTDIETIDSKNPTSIRYDDFNSKDTSFSQPDTAANDERIHTVAKPLKTQPAYFRHEAQRQLFPKLLAEWSGYVTSLENTYSFNAVLKGITGKGVKDEYEEAVISISDVSDSDRELLKVGNFFRLCVMHEVSSAGQPRRYTQVIFRRLPAYRQQDLDEANERGLALARSIRVE
jgi:hypothetical protein